MPLKQLQRKEEDLGSLIHRQGKELQHIVNPRNTTYRKGKSLGKFSY